MLNVITDRLAIDAAVDDEVVAYDAVTRGLARPQLYGM
jgi:hypothetical protein